MGSQTSVAPVQDSITIQSSIGLPEFPVDVELNCAPAPALREGFLCGVGRPTKQMGPASGAINPINKVLGLISDNEWTMLERARLAGQMCREDRGLPGGRGPC